MHKAVSCLLNETEDMVYKTLSNVQLHCMLCTELNRRFKHLKPLIKNTPPVGQQLPICMFNII